MVTLEQLGDGSVSDRNFRRIATKLNQPLPQARVYNSSNISTSTATITALSFDSERYDSGALHATGGTASRLTAQITGLYHIGGNIRWAASATGIRQIAVRLNGTTFIAVQYITATGGDTALSIATDWQMTKGDYVELTAYQTSGGTLNVITSDALSPEFWMHRVGGFTNEGV